MESTNSQKGHVLLVAAENDALPGGKVGGIGDVIRDIAPALASAGVEVSVLTPAYGVFASGPDARHLLSITTPFAGQVEPVELFEVAGRERVEGVRHLVLDHPGFSPRGPGRIYCDDPPQAPFETDATKFALFNAGVAAGLAQGAFGAIDIVHLHDWHAALVAALIRLPGVYQKQLSSLRCVYSIHNLALQGIRPLAGAASSLAAWFPSLDHGHPALADPRWPGCVNPMAVGIRLADAVHAVSPAYAQEIQRPSDPGSGFFGGEGLENDLLEAGRQGRLFGILNGCSYGDSSAGGPAVSPLPDWPAFLKCAEREIVQWASRDERLASAHFVADKSLPRLPVSRPGLLVTGVGRVTAQKFGLLRERLDDGRFALAHMLDRLGDRGVLVLLGTGDVELERFLVETAAAHDNFLFLRGYSDELARVLYATGDLFLMPSSFEPCGIGQMLAMRDGQPCLVHHVGGLRDTVRDGQTGFAFEGDGPRNQARALVARFTEAVQMQADARSAFDAIGEAAARERFEWSDSVREYLVRLYGRTDREAAEENESGAGGGRLLEA